ncbi:hypothetical protein [Clostridium kluyveri]|uniref:Uncharacterized protein n=1 Tax=Clostridium kluyveri TaxID=1534 RepID=A0A1L5FED6_CLOKL|nr:hypothetical protein [Clostridium kluyveri]APM41358.1 hypothetical protein BS101_21860 [Clostridium kluyveri]
MRYALIDNSTLTAVQRILGEIPIKNKHTIDGDIIALENYIQAILFYDKLIYLDDYKETYRDSREKFFDNMMNFSPSEVGYSSLLKTAKQITEEIVPCVEGGKFSDKDFKPFFDLLKMNVTFTWDIRSSVYFLTEKMLEEIGGIDVEKYSKLSNMIFMELSEKKITKKNNTNGKIKLYDSHGREINSSYKVIDRDGKEQDTELSRQVEVFFAALNWLAFRTSLYTLLAKEMNLELILHPIRNQFQISLLSKINKGKEDVFKNIINAMNGKAVETFTKITETTQPFVLQQPLPLFTVWLAQKTKNPCNFIEEAYSIRSNKEFVQARQKLIELECLLEEQNYSKFVKEANKLNLEIKNEINMLCSRYGVTTNQGVPLTQIISVYNMTTLATNLPKVPNINVDIKPLAFLRDIIPKKGFKSIYRNLINDLISISRTGKYYEIISSNVKLDKGARYYDSKTEKIEYSKAKSWWKIPM